MTLTRSAFIRYMHITLLFCVLFSTFVVEARSVNILETRFSQDKGKAKIVLELEKEIKYSYFQLAAPHRLVIDLQNVDKGYDLSRLSVNSESIKKIRHSKPKSPNDTRIVIESDEKLNVKLVPIEAGSSQENFRLVVELSGLKDTQVARTASERDDSVNDARPAANNVLALGPNRDKDIIIVVDAGHGGVDPGSVGPSGTYEKNITLSIAKMLEKRINSTPGMRAVMTRTGDYYISPNERPKFAAKENADLLVSIHADAFTTPQPRGGSVWVLSKGRADSELGRLLEQTERSSEMLGAAAEIIEDRDTERYFAETIFNMSMDLSRASSYELSNEVIKDMKQVTKMHKRRPQSASLAVLTTPETPSILVEVGFISNPQEEKNLNWAKHRQRLAEALFSSITRYFRKTPPDGTLWAMEKNQLPIEHRISSGESLSLLAQQYGVSVKDIKNYNNLSSDLVRIGQTLKIPRS